MNTLRLLYLAIVIFVGQTIESGFAIGIEDFLIPSILMGLGVAIDVTLVTLAKFRDENLSWHNWTLPVTITHTLFPAFGYFLFWSLDETFPVAHTLLGITGFIFVFLFVYEVLTELHGKKPIFGLTNWISAKFNFEPDDARTYIAVLAVSWDALWSGPARAAQASASSWSGLEVFLSFVIAGVVVAIVAEISLTIAKTFAKRATSTGRRLVPLTIFGHFLELSVIGGFGVLSLWHAFFGNADLYVSIAISATLLLFIFIPTYKSMKLAQLRKH